MVEAHHRAHVVERISHVASTGDASLELLRLPVLFSQSSDDEAHPM